MWSFLIRTDTGKAVLLYRRHLRVTLDKWEEFPGVSPGLFSPSLIYSGPIVPILSSINVFLDGTGRAARQVGANGLAV